ncbi:uncharacterized protein BXZ73DRAFT_84837 [Epithele typhae]|uniref:uncharacterized protein n=1 Tax=Epithele typhae TaxID=378194 RepID=UPI002008091B|nr:uncharacterized protein BXZ73DRAFT_84837 [Epithele typhae]KAH9906574.1 hypothetical protein BXZ73DRAFT_84837 [Epithele typhae]
MEPNDSNKPKGRLYNDSDDEEGFFETEEEWLEQLRKANEPQGENAGMEDIAQPPRPRKRARIRSPDVESEEDVEAESALPGPSVARYNIPSRVPGMRQRFDIEGRDFFAIPESTLPSVDGHKRWEGRAASRPATMADLEAIRTEIANNSELVRRTLAQNQGLQEDVAALTARVLELEQVNHTLMTAPTLLSPFMFDATADFNEPPPSTPHFMTNFDVTLPAPTPSFHSPPPPPKSAATTPPVSLSAASPPVPPHTTIPAPLFALPSASAGPIIPAHGSEDRARPTSPSPSPLIPRLLMVVPRLPSYASSSSDEKAEEHASRFVIGEL